MSRNKGYDPFAVDAGKSANGAKTPAPSADPMEELLTSSATHKSVDWPSDDAGWTPDGKTATSAAPIVGLETLIDDELAGAATQPGAAESLDALMQLETETESAPTTTPTTTPTTAPTTATTTTATTTRAAPTPAQPSLPSSREPGKTVTQPGGIDWAHPGLVAGIGGGVGLLLLVGINATLGGVAIGLSLLVSLALHLTTRH